MKIQELWKQATPIPWPNDGQSDDAPAFEHEPNYTLAAHSANVLPQALEALKDAHDFINAIHEATTNGGRIDENSIMRLGERLKTTAAKLDTSSRLAISAIEDVPAKS